MDPTCKASTFSFSVIATTNSGVGDAVPLWKWNIIEASVTVICACLFASKPAVMFLIPDKFVARLTSRTRSWTRYRRKKFIHARGEQSGETFESSPHPRSASLYTAQDHPHQAVRYDLEAYGDIASQTFLDISEAVTEPTPAKIRKESAV